ncbi:50S ribosomal protein L20 [bacterium]|nr:50S ribosomal protein L20 [bacterium]
MRSTQQAASHRRRKKFVKAASGYFGGRHRLYRTAREVVEKAWQFQYAHRKQRKREFRKLWIARINAAARLNGTTYSKLMNSLKRANIQLNRKMLAAIALEDPDTFSRVVQAAEE